MSTQKLLGKVSIITGASSGIGAATAVHFGSLGSDLAIVGRNRSNLQTVQKQITDAGHTVKVLPIVADLSRELDTIDVVNKTIEAFGKLDILVNSAGILTKGTVENTTLQSYDELMNINVRSVFHLMQLSIPHLKKTKGSIVNVSSVTGLRAFPGVVAYNLSKAALDQLTRTAALELAADGIRVNAVNPGVIVTEVHKRGGMTDDDYAKFLEHSKTTHAMGRVGEAIEVAKAIAFLASDDASYTTGATLPVDGGRAQMCPR
ncbi:3-oxoacyl-[acyl-carrier-protein] reductase FabG-like [Oppia nitens]|uniref:3-oxoacyl-[acyl-carrier-protein] reductase FabG-like n=1 Tax=Oppia nitens TaxID=1686743 RepID=UPI0023DBCAA4|nr:3-oxoacyl-[acyl-carrier-protein] reductase FabG-like [Oppia nitens]